MKLKLLSNLFITILIGGFTSLNLNAQSSIFNEIDNNGSLGCTSTVAGQINYNSYLAIHTATGRLFASGTTGTLNRINVFTFSGNNMVNIQQTNTSFVPKDLVFAPSDGRLFILGGNSRLYVATTSGGSITITTSLGVVGNGIGQFSFPQGIDMDAQNRIYISEYSGSLSRVSVYSISGNNLSHISTFGVNTGTGVDLLYKPYSLKRQNGLIYVADAGDININNSGKIKVLTLNGSNLQYVGEMSFGISSLPYHIDFDDAGRMYFSDIYSGGNNNVRVFTGSGLSFTQINSIVYGTEAPLNIVTSGTGTVFTTNNNNCNLRMFKECNPRVLITANTPHQTVCGSNLATVAVTATGAGLTYAWSNGATTPTLSTNTTGAYRVTVTGTCGLSISTIMSVTGGAALTQIVTQPVISNGTICANTFVGISVSATGAGAIRYLWSNGRTTSGINVSLVGTYMATATGFCGTAVSNSVAINQVNPITQIVTQPAFGEVCSPNLGFFTVSATGTPPLSYLWTNGATASITGTSSSTYRNVTVTGGCGKVVSNSAGIIVHNPIAITSFSPTNISMCAGESKTITVTGTGSEGNHLWSNGAYFPYDINNIYTVRSVLTVTGPGNYSVSIGNYCNTVTSGVSVVTRFPLTSITSTFADSTAICIGSSKDYTVTAIGGNLAFEWNTGEMQNGGTIFTKTASTSGLYRLTVTGLCGPPSVSNTAKLNVMPLTTILSSLANQTVCAGNFTTFTPNDNGVNLQYSWSNGTTTSMINTSAAGFYNYTVNGFCGSSQVSNQAELTVLTIVGNSEIITQPVSQNVCPGTIVNFNVVANGYGTLNYLWNSGETVSGISKSVPGNYQVTVSGICGTQVSTIAGLTNKLATSITTQPVSQSTICGTNTVSLSVVANGEAPLSYLWSSGETTTSVSKSTIGNYAVTITGSCGSIVSNTATITPCSTTTSINQNGNLEIGIEVYPNPTEGNFSIKAPISSQIEVVNSNGLVLKQIITTSDISQMYISQKGLLLIKITSGNNISYRKIVIE